MSTQVNRRNTLYGYPNPQAGLQQEPIVTNRDPLASDTAELGTVWVNTVSQSYFILCSSVQGVNTWTSATNGAETLTALTVNPGNITVTAGDVDITAGNLNMAPGSSASLGDVLMADASIGSTLFVTGAVSFGSTLFVTGDTTVDGSLDVTGNVIVNGDFNLTSVDEIELTTTSNTDPAMLFTANGGALERIVVQAVQGTDPAAIELHSIVGGVSLTGGLDDGNALNFDASNAAGGMTFVAGTEGYLFSATDGAFTVLTGTGSISIGTDDVSKNIFIGNSFGTSGILVGAGSSGLLLSSLGDIAISGTTTLVLGTTGNVTIDSTGGTIGIGTAANANNINIGTGAAARVVTVGNNIAGSGISLVAGTGNLSASSTGTLGLSSAGALSINSSAGVINVGNNAVAQAINIGTGAAARAITIGNVTSTTSLTVNVGTGSSLNLGTSATAHATTVGSTTAGCTLVLNTPTGTNVAAANGLSVTTAGRGLSLPGGLLVISGTGSPSGTVTAPIGSLYLRVDPAGATSRAYINTDAGTTWTNITCAG